MRAKRAETSMPDRYHTRNTRPSSDAAGVGSNHNDPRSPASCSSWSVKRSPGVLQPERPVLSSEKSCGHPPSRRRIGYLHRYPISGPPLLQKPPCVLNKIMRI